MSKHIILNNI